MVVDDSSFQDGASEFFQISWSVVEYTPWRFLHPGVALLNFTLARECWVCRTTTPHIHFCVTAVHVHELTFARSTPHGNTIHQNDDRNALTDAAGTQRLLLEKISITRTSAAFAGDSKVYGSLVNSSRVSERERNSHITAPYQSVAKVPAAIRSRCQARLSE
jgi:hypothetical protein